MSFRLLAFLLTSLASFGHSTELVIHDHCTGKIIASQEFDSSGQTVMDLSKKALRNAGITYSENNEGSFKYVNSSPWGIKAIEYLSNSKMRVYDWCYAVDGVVYINKPANRYQLTGDESHITWFYGYALYQSGSWSNECNFNPSFANPTFCKK